METGVLLLSIRVYQYTFLQMHASYTFRAYQAVAVRFISVALSFQRLYANLSRYGTSS
jgi:hypothetical protein